MSTVLVFPRKPLKAELEPIPSEADGGKAVQMLLDELNPLLSEVKSSSRSCAGLSSSLARVISLLELALDKIASVVGAIDQPVICGPIMDKVESARNELQYARQNAILLESLIHG